MEKSVKISALALLICIFASQLYSMGASDEPSASQIYNNALALYKSGQFDEVESELGRLSVQIEGEDEIRNLMLKSASEFRLGEGIANDAGDYTGALVNIDKSIGYLKRVVQMDSANLVAANNLEAALLYREELGRRREQKQQNSQSNDTLQDDLNQLKEEQRNLAEDQNKNSADHRNQQEEMNRKTEDLKNRGEGGSNFREHMEKAEEAQKSAAEALELGEFHKAEDFQNEAVQHLESASASLSGQEAMQEGAEQGENQFDDSEQLIKSIIDNENRRNGSSDNSGSGIAVERNW